MQKFWIILPKLYMKRCNLYNLATLCHLGVYFMDFTMVDGPYQLVLEMAPESLQQHHQILL